MISEQIKLIFKILNESNIRFFLLRPVQLSNKITDIDLIVQKSDLQQLLVEISTSELAISIKKTPYNESIKVIVGKVILDIQFYPAFFPRKSLVIKHTPPYSKAIYSNEHNAFLPEVNSEVLFTFWVLRLMLDKTSADLSNSYLLFKKMYSHNSLVNLKSDFFRKWNSLVFRKKNAEAFDLIQRFCEGGFNDKSGLINKELKKLVFRDRPSFYLRRLFDEFRFRLLRKTGVYSRIFNIGQLQKLKL